MTGWGLSGVFFGAFAPKAHQAFHSYCAGVSRGPVSLPDGRQALQSLTLGDLHIRVMRAPQAWKD